MIYGGGPEGRQLYLYQDRETAGLPEVIDRQFFLQDGHCSYSPDRQWILYDSYPDSEQFRHLYLYDLTQSKGMRLGSYFSPSVSITDIRCDLHPRWNRSGTAISFDCMHEGRREIRYMDLQEIMDLRK